MLIGVAGAVLPVIPGPPISLLGLVLLHFSRWADFSGAFFAVMGGIALVATLLDYVIPAWGTRRLGGSDAGVRGSVIGVFAGLFIFPPFGIIVGPIVGAMLAELARNRRNYSLAFRSGVGSLLGFLLGTGLKLAASVLMLYYFAEALLI